MNIIPNAILGPGLYLKQPCPGRRFVSLTLSATLYMLSFGLFPLSDTHTQRHREEAVLARGARARSRLSSLSDDRLHKLLVQSDKAVGPQI
jgi:hypothetical protein